MDDTGQAVLDLIAGYADTWRLPMEYDEDRLPAPPGTGPSSGVLDHECAMGAIAEFRRDLMGREQALPPFGSPRGDALAAIQGSIEQTMFVEPLRSAGAGWSALFQDIRADASPRPWKPTP